MLLRLPRDLFLECLDFLSVSDLARLDTAYVVKQSRDMMMGWCKTEHVGIYSNEAMNTNTTDLYDWTIRKGLCLRTLSLTEITSFHYYPLMDQVRDLIVWLRDDAQDHMESFVERARGCIHLTYLSFRNMSNMNQSCVLSSIAAFPTSNLTTIRMSGIELNPMFIEKILRKLVNCRIVDLQFTRAASGSGIVLEFVNFVSSSELDQCSWMVGFDVFYGRFDRSKSELSLSMNFQFHPSDEATVDAVRNCCLKKSVTKLIVHSMRSAMNQFVIQLSLPQSCTIKIN